MKITRYEGMGTKNILVVSQKEAINLLAIISKQLQTKRNILESLLLENGERFDIQIDFEKEES